MMPVGPSQPGSGWRRMTLRDRVSITATSFLSSALTYSFPRQWIGANSTDPPAGTVATALAVAGWTTVMYPSPGGITHSASVAGSYIAASGFFPVGIVARTWPVRPSIMVAVLAV